MVHVTENSEAVVTGGVKHKAVDKASLSRLFKDNLLLFPFDALVILFLAQTMLPVWAAVILALINFGTWYCYYKIPEYLRMVSGTDGQRIIIPGPIISHFALFVSSCGVHHRAHYGLMLAMMAGFHAMMDGRLFGGQIDYNSAMFVGYAALFLLIYVDFNMLYKSYRAMQELRADKLKEVAEYTEELERSNENLEQFAYIASHDLRSPLRAMDNLVGWLEEDTEEYSTPDVKEKFELLKQRIGRLDNILNDLLQYSRIGREQTEVEEINLHKLAKDIFDEVSTRSDDKLHLTGKNIKIQDYLVTYNMLLSNIISNAIKHNDKDKAEIWLNMQQVNNLLQITIEDNGPGIEEKYYDRVFNVFTTLSRRDEKEATGMGLAIVKKIATHKNGDVVISKSDKGGAKFVISIPIIG